MKTSKQSRQSAFRDLEQFLRANESDLRTASVQRYIAAFPSHQVKTDMPYVNMVMGGTEYMHRMALVAAALYPSETTLRREYEWTTSGPLIRYGVGFEQQLALLNAYWSSARAMTKPSSATAQAIDTLERSMIRVLRDVFSVSGGNELALNG